MEDRLKKMRTFILCLIAEVGLLALAHHGSWQAIETSVAVAVPLAAWIGGKAWASSMEMLKVTRA